MERRGGARSHGNLPNRPGFLSSFALFFGPYRCDYRHYPSGLPYSSDCSLGPSPSSTRSVNAGKKRSKSRPPTNEPACINPISKEANANGRRIGLIPISFAIITTLAHKTSLSNWAAQIPAGRLQSRRAQNPIHVPRRASAEPPDDISEKMNKRRAFSGFPRPATAYVTRQKGLAGT